MLHSAWGSRLALVEVVRSLGKQSRTYRRASKEYLRRLSIADAFEQLVDDVLCHLDMHGLNWGLFGHSRADVTVWSGEEGNAPRGKQRSGGHVEWWAARVGESRKMDRGVSLAHPDVGKGDDAWREHLGSRQQAQ